MLVNKTKAPTTYTGLQPKTWTQVGDGLLPIEVDTAVPVVALQSMNVPAITDTTGQVVLPGYAIYFAPGAPVWVRPAMQSDLAALASIAQPNNTKTFNGVMQLNPGDKISFAQLATNVPSGKLTGVTIILRTSIDGNGSAVITADSGSITMREGETFSFGADTNASQQLPLSTTTNVAAGAGTGTSVVILYTGPSA